MTDTEWHMYCDWHSFLAETLPLRFDAIVYLRTDPKVGCLPMTIEHSHMSYIACVYSMAACEEFERRERVVFDSSD